MTIPRRYVDAYLAQRMTLYEISDATGISASGVWKSLRNDYGVDTGGYRRRVIAQVKDRNEEIVGLRRKGIGVSEIGREMGLSRQRVSQIIKKLAPELLERSQVGATTT
jgi:DNA-binding transcriptional regulator GbsR (MarR family)